MADQKLRIGLLSTAYPPVSGGAEVYVQQIAHALHSAGHEVSVNPRFAEERPSGGTHGLLTSTAPSHSYTDNGVRVNVLGASPFRQRLLAPVHRLHFYAWTQPLAIRLFDAAYRPALKRALQNVDVIHYSGTGRELLGFVAARMARERGCPFVVTSHLHRDAWGDGPLDLQLYRQADQYIALTQQEEEHVVHRGLSPDRVTVIGHGVNVAGTGDAERARAKLEIDGPLIFFLGRRTAYKGYGRLLEAASRVWNAVSDAHIVVAGPEADDTERLQSRYASTRADARFHDLGFVSDAMREDLYAASDIFCLPSSGEAYGLVYLEAWAYETPVVAQRIPTTEELIGGTGGGLLTDGSAEGLAEALVHLLQYPHEREQLGRAGRTKAKDHTWSRVAQLLTDVYKSLWARSS